MSAIRGGDDWSSGAELGRPAAKVRHRRWIALFVLLPVLGLVILVSAVVILFSGPSPMDRASREEQAALATAVERWSIAHGGALPASSEELGLDEKDDLRLDPWGRPYAIEEATFGRGFRIVSLGRDGERDSSDRTSAFPRPIVVLVESGEDGPRFTLWSRETSSEEELASWLGVQLRKGDEGASTFVVSAPAVPREAAERAAEIAREAGFTDVAFAELAR